MNPTNTKAFNSEVLSQPEVIIPLLERANQVVDIAIEKGIHEIDDPNMGFLEVGLQVRAFLQKTGKITEDIQQSYSVNEVIQQLTPEEVSEINKRILPLVLHIEFEEKLIESTSLNAFRVQLKKLPEELQQRYFVAIMDFVDSDKKDKSDDWNRNSKNLYDLILKKHIPIALTPDFIQLNNVEKNVQERNIEVLLNQLNGRYSGLALHQSEEILFATTLTPSADIAVEFVMHELAPIAEIVEAPLRDAVNTLNSPEPDPVIVDNAGFLLLRLHVQIEIENDTPEELVKRLFISKGDPYTATIELIEEEAKFLREVWTELTGGNLDPASVLDELQLLGIDITLLKNSIIGERILPFEFLMVIAQNNDVGPKLKAFLVNRIGRLEYLPEVDSVNGDMLLVAQLVEIANSRYLEFLVPVNGSENEIIRSPFYMRPIAILSNSEIFQNKNIRLSPIERWWLNLWDAENDSLLLAEPQKIYGRIGRYGALLYPYMSLNQSAINEFKYQYLPAVLDAQRRLFRDASLLIPEGVFHKIVNMPTNLAINEIAEQLNIAINLAIEFIQGYIGKERQKQAQLLSELLLNGDMFRKSEQMVGLFTRFFNKAPTVSDIKGLAYLIQMQAFISMNGNNAYAEFWNFSNESKPYIKELYRAIITGCDDPALTFGELLKKFKEKAKYPDDFDRLVIRMVAHITLRINDELLRVNTVSRYNSIANTYSYMFTRKEIIRMKRMHMKWSATRPDQIVKLDIQDRKEEKFLLAQLREKITGLVIPNAIAEAITVHKPIIDLAKLLVERVSRKDLRNSKFGFNENNKDFKFALELFKGFNKKTQKILAAVLMGVPEVGGLIGKINQKELFFEFEQFADALFNKNPLMIVALNTTHNDNEIHVIPVNKVANAGYISIAEQLETMQKVAAKIAKLLKKKFELFTQSEIQEINSSLSSLGNNVQEVSHGIPLVRHLMQQTDMSLVGIAKYLVDVIEGKFKIEAIPEHPMLLPAVGIRKPDSRNYTEVEVREMRNFLSPKYVEVPLDVFENVNLPVIVRLTGVMVNSIEELEELVGKIIAKQKADEITVAVETLNIRKPAPKKAEKPKSQPEFNTKELFSAKVQATTPDDEEAASKRIAAFLEQEEKSRRDRQKGGKPKFKKGVSPKPRPDRDR